MPHELQREIENHLASFPERHKDIIEMQTEWKEFRKEQSEFHKKMLLAMFGFIGAILAIGMWVGTIQAQHSQFEAYIAKTDGYDNRITALEINNSAILARLSSIDTTLTEIKLAVKELH